mmetsp:Transcript_83685/g.249769  ORF Transcript_83685/g.249769 Transcript_83685/m.249769 type:complete len:354 (+) Transcript_83685:116-1177(+)
MGASLDACTKCFFEEVESFQDGRHYYTQGSGPYFRLRVDWNPIRESPGAITCPFRLTDELVVEALELQGPRGWWPLQQRHERWKQDRVQPWGAGSSLLGMPRLPSGPRYSIPKRFARARIQDRSYLLQVAAASEDRSMENVKADIIDARDTAAWAVRFNRHLAEAVRGEDPDALGSSAPGVQVCAPIGCCVLETAIPQLAGQRHGEVVTLTPYPAPEVIKFIFDGTEEFLEMPHAFLHYVAWASGGRELPYDLQGVECEEGVLLVDPCLMRKERSAVQDLLGPILDGRSSSRSSSDASREMGPSPERFEALHKRCGPLCRTFDPSCRTGKGKKVCGLDVHCRLNNSTNDSSSR